MRVPKRPTLWDEIEFIHFAPKNQYAYNFDSTNFTWPLICFLGLENKSFLSSNQMFHFLLLPKLIFDMLDFVHLIHLINSYNPTFLSRFCGPGTALP